MTDLPRQYRGLKPHSMRQSLYELAEAINWHCGICGASIRETPELVSEDHVTPRARGGGSYGNVIAAHRDCNSRKSDRMPTGCELIYLAVTNAVIGVDFSHLSA